MRNANAALFLAIVLGVIVVVTVAQVHKSLPILPTILLVSMSGCLVIAAAYRLANIHITSAPLAITTKVKFYILLALMEWMVTLCLFAVNARTLFGEDLAKEKKSAAKHGKGQASKDQFAMRPSFFPAQQNKDPYASV
jgi:predicted membrane protein